MTTPAAAGTRWLRFWIFVGLPAWGAAALLLSFHLPRFRYEIFPIAILCAAVAIGLHKRRLWAWQWNWVVVGTVFLALLVPLPMRAIEGGFADFVTAGVVELIASDWTGAGFADVVVPFLLRLALASLLWMWPNWRYWNKRAALFS